MAKDEYRRTNEVLHQIRDALRELMQSSASQDAQRLSAALRQVTTLESQLGDDAPPMLRHYLSRRSYAKALAFLETETSATDTPRCG